jgi:PAS domain S-box-containing protein
VAETVALYLQKALDHDRVLVGVYEPGQDALEGWTAVRNGEVRCRPFRLTGQWDGALRRVIEENQPVHATSADEGPVFLSGEGIADELAAFAPDQLGPYLAYPMSGGGPETQKMAGVLMVGRSSKGSSVGEVDAGILESVAGAVGTAMENVILEEDVRREEAFRKDVMGSMAAGLIAVDLEGRVLTMNACAERLTGFSLTELRNQVPTLLDPGSGGVSELLTKTLRSRKPVLHAERAVRRADGGAFPAACATALLRNPAGEIYGAIATLEDLTRIKEMQERIRSLDRLAALGRFTAGIAHEIRNPLTGIGTGVQYLERHLKAEGEHMENLAFIQREIVRLNRIVEDLFRVTHPQPLRKTPEDVKGLVERALRSLGTLAAEREVQVNLHLAPDLPRVPADPDQIQQVLLNLLKNAVEATPKGKGVDLHVYASPEAERPTMAFQVIDSGRGIDPESMIHIFEPFFTKGKPDGTGLGLYVSHGIVERHGGELHVANNNGTGAIFTVKLPLNDTT